MNKIFNSEIDLFGRIGIFITMCVSIVVANSFWVSTIYKAELPYVVQLFMAFIIGIIGLLLIAMAVAVSMLLIGAIGWVFTGGFWGDGIDAIYNFVGQMLVLGVKFLYGNWWRAK